MDTKDVIALLQNAVKEAEGRDVQAIDLVELRAYVGQLQEWQAEDEKDGFDATNQALRLEQFRGKITGWLEDRKREHESSLELFRSTIQAALNALRTCLLINGGAAVALLAFVGHVATNDVAFANVPIASVARAMGAYVVGVLAGGFAAGFTYLAQWCFVQDWDKSGTGFNITAILFGLASLALFGAGSYLAYEVFVAL